jgi:hypothetical protein
MALDLMRARPTALLSIAATAIASCDLSGGATVQGGRIHPERGTVKGRSPP